MSSTPIREGGSFHTMADQKMYEMPELVVMSTDSHLPPPPPVSKTAKVSPADDRSVYESPYNSVCDFPLNVVCNLFFSYFS
jgi:hypothetical protein